jgi:hypothetical protein
LFVTVVAQIWGILFATVKVMIILAKAGWATFWTIFSQTHLVTHFKTVYLNVDSAIFTKYLAVKINNEKYLKSISNNVKFPHGNICSQ